MGCLPFPPALQALMISNPELLEAQLAAQPFFQRQVISRSFPKRDHYNVLPDAFGAGLQALLGWASQGRLPAKKPPGS
jgi:hypothetical protein